MGRRNRWRFDRNGDRTFHGVPPSEATHPERGTRYGRGAEAYDLDDRDERIAAVGHSQLDSDMQGNVVRNFLAVRQRARVYGEASSADRCGVH